MHIALDATAVRSLNHGIGTYVGNLLPNLVEVEPENEYVCYLTGRAMNNLQPLGIPSDRVRYQRVTEIRPLRLLWEHFLLPLVVSDRRTDLLWGCHNTLPSFKTSPQVVTIHDIGMIVLSRYYPRVKVGYFRRAITHAVKQADVVIADSQFTAGELTRHLGVAEERIRVVQCAVADQFRVIADERELSRVRETYHLPERFVLSVGVPEPKKNLERVIRAFAGLVSRRAIPHKLVIGGGRSFGWKNSRTYHLARSLSEDVIMTDFIAQRDLPAVYTLADLFVFPSLYEGFGLPPLEAMACGTPVVSSTAASLPEVLGDAAVLVDPEDEEQLADAMLRVLTDSGLRSRLRELGRVNAGRFSWSSAARELTKVFKEAAA